MSIGARAGGQRGQPSPPPKKRKNNNNNNNKKNKKMNVFRQKIDAIRTKINHMNFICI